MQSSTPLIKKISLIPNSLDVSFSGDLSFYWLANCYLKLNIHQSEAETFFGDHGLPGKGHLAHIEAVLLRIKGLELQLRN